MVLTLKSSSLLKVIVQYFFNTKVMFELQYSDLVLYFTTTFYDYNFLLTSFLLCNFDASLNILVRLIFFLRLRRKNWEVRTWCDTGRACPSCSSPCPFPVRISFRGRKIVILKKQRSTSSFRHRKNYLQQIASGC